MSKVIAIAVLIRGIDLFRVFDYVKVMTDSGPGTATETLTSYAGRIYFQRATFPMPRPLSLMTLILVIVVVDPVHEDLQGEALMEQSSPMRMLRDIAAVLVVGIFMFPLFWWALTSIKPMYAIFNKDGSWSSTSCRRWSTTRSSCSAGRAPRSPSNSGSTFGVGGASSYDSRQTIVDSHRRLDRLDGDHHGDGGASPPMPCRAWRSRAATAYLNWVLGQRFMPPIAIIVPLVMMYKVAGMRDTDNLFLGYLGLILIHALMNLPIAVLLMKSFFDDVPKDVDEAAMIDGATRWQTFRQGGAADGARRRRGGRRAVFHLLLDRVPAVAVSHHHHPHGAGQDSPLS